MLQSYQRSLDTDRGSLDLVEARLDQINKMKRKYGGSLEAVLAKQDAITAELTAIENLDDDIRRGEEKLNALYDQLAGRARQLSKKRKQVARDFADAVEAELAGLKMTGTRFRIDFPVNANTKQKIS